MNIPSNPTWDPCFRAKCPLCGKRSTFLQLGVDLGHSKGHLITGVICEDCGLEIKTEDPSERERLTEAAAIWKRHEQGLIDAATAMSGWMALDSSVLKRILAEGATWKCPRCGEEIPQNVLGCWNCQFERPLEENEKAGLLGEPAPDLPPEDGTPESGENIARL